MSDPDTPNSSKAGEPEIEAPIETSDAELTETPEAEAEAPEAETSEAEADAEGDIIAAEETDPIDDEAAPTAPALSNTETSPPIAKPPIWRRRSWQIGAGVAASLLIVLVLSLLWSLPLSRALEPLDNSALVLVAADGSPIARRGSYKEAPIDLKTLPPYVPGAFVAIEDRRFYKHMGVDLRAVARAVGANAKAGGVSEGGSTITQQLAKNAFLSNDRNLRRKAQEALIALYLEARLSKDEILSRYLSSVYFGNGAFGVQAASRQYFDKPAERLTLGEAAMLAGMVKAPSRLAPSSNLEGATERMHAVLAAMVDTEVITPEQAKAAPGNVHVNDGRLKMPTGSYFADWAIPQARAAVGARYGETVVRTTLDPKLQAKAEAILRQALDRDGKGLNITQGAIVAMRSDGRVVAMVGGRDYGASQFNRADGARQPGSAFKLFVYLAAMRKGMTTTTPISDSPVELSGWKPKNHEGKYHDREVPLITAFAASSNVAAVRLAHQLGRAEIVRTARDLGVTEPIPEDLTLALGTGPMSLVRLTAAYAAIAAGEAPIVAHGLENWKPKVQPKPLGKAELASMRDMLRSAVHRGTGLEAAIPGAFGKTGTTQNYRDALFVGYIDDLVVGVWVGNDNNSAMHGVVGGGEPAIIWRQFMISALGRAAPPPPKVEEIPVEFDDLGLPIVDPAAATIPLPPTPPTEPQPAPQPAPAPPADPTIR
jgi:penicillin-binding protein 1A